jgi:hypothetical protein
MCCPLCEEPVRSVLFGLAAIGAVSIVRTVQKTLKCLASKDASVAERALARIEVINPADSGP